MNDEEIQRFENVAYAGRPKLQTQLYCLNVIQNPSCPVMEWLTIRTQYDVNSIMHYPQTDNNYGSNFTFFNINDEALKNCGGSCHPGQRVGYTEEDKHKINLLYGWGKYPDIILTIE